MPSPGSQPMGEDFLRRKSESFVRRRDAYFVELVEPDLFAATHAREQTEVVGQVAAGIALELGDELWSPPSAKSESVRFFRGDREAVICDGLSAEHLRSEDGQEAGFIARVLEVAPDDGLAVLATSPIGRIRR